MKQRIVLIVSVVIGLLAAFLARQYLRAKDAEVAQRLQQIEKGHAKIWVVIALQDLPAGHVLTRQDLGSIEVFEKGQRGHVVLQDDASMLINRKTLIPLPAKSAIFWTDIEGGDPSSRGLAADIKPGLRAVSINVAGAAAVSGMVRPNNHVDVLGTFTFPSRTRPGEMELVTLTIIQDVTILATGRDTAKSLLTMGDRGSGYSTVTLEVTPREAEMLVFAEQIKGRLSLALRSSEDVAYERELPRVNFERIEAEIESLNTYRQRVLLRKKE